MNHTEEGQLTAVSTVKSTIHMPEKIYELRFTLVGARGFEPPTSVSRTLKIEAKNHVDINRNLAKISSWYISDRILF